MPLWLILSFHLFRFINWSGITEREEEERKERNGDGSEMKPSIPRLGLRMPARSKNIPPAIDYRNSRKALICASPNVDLFAPFHIFSVFSYLMR